MPDAITEARLKRTIDQLHGLQRTLENMQSNAGGQLEIDDTTVALQTLTSLVLDLASAVRTVAQRNP